jgi:tetratricopeptide (TPR) repeat protein
MGGDLLTKENYEAKYMVSNFPAVDSSKSVLTMNAVPYAVITITLAIVVSISGSLIGVFTVIALTIFGFILFTLVNRMHASSSPYLRQASHFLLWAVVLWFSVWLALTTSAVGFGVPEVFARAIGVKSFCQREVDKMWNAVLSANNLQSDALRMAEELSDCAPANAASVRGAISFFRGDYLDALPRFEKAHSLFPDDDLWKRNLADTLIEIGAKADIERAVKLYESIKNKDKIVRYKLGRAYLYAENYSKSHDLLQSLPESFDEDGGISGKAQVLDAAALLGLAKERQSSAQAFHDEAKVQFLRGFKHGKCYWTDILTGSAFTRFETFIKAKELIGPHLHAWIT